MIPESCSGGEGVAGPGPGSAPAPDDEEAREGLLKVAASMRRRLDTGRLQLEAQRRLLHQKQALVAAGEAVLAEHCRASWQHAQRVHPGTQGLGSSSAGAGFEVRSLQAECAAGQWRLRAVVARRQGCKPGWGSSGTSGGGGDRSLCSSLTLLASSGDCSLVCSQQQCTLLHSSNVGQGGDIGSSAADGPPLLELTAALEVQQRGGHDSGLLGQGHGQQAAGDAAVDVFLLQEDTRSVGSSAAAAAAAPRAAPPALPPVPLGRVHLRWQEWLQSHSRPLLPQPALSERWRHRRALAAASERLDLSCIHRIVQKQLGCIPAGNTAESPDPCQAGGSQHLAAQLYVLPGPPTQQSCGPARAAAEVQVTQHGGSFAEVELRAGSRQVLSVMEQQLGQGLAAAAAQAGTPAGAVSLVPSLLSLQHAQQVSTAADALVSELDASIEWIEALLKHKLALGSQQRRQQQDAPPDCWAAEVRRRQASALTAMAATDASMVELLR